MFTEGDPNIMTIATIKRSKKVEQCIETLSDIFGSKEEVLITLLEILESDGDFYEQREEIFQEIKKLHEGMGQSGKAIAK